METLLRKYLWAIDLAVIAICAIFSARAAATAVESQIAAIAPAPKPAPHPVSTAPQTVSSKGFMEILKRNVCCSTCPPIIEEPKAHTDGPPPPAAPQRTTLPLKLLAIMFAPAPADPRWSMAIIRDTDAKTSGAFSIGGKIREAL